MKTNGKENTKGKSLDDKRFDDIRMENKPSKPRKNKFEIGEMRIMSIAAVSRPSEDAVGEEVCYLPLGGKADEWISEETLSKTMPLNEDVACFVSGYRSGFKDGYDLAEQKAQKYLNEFLTELFEKHSHEVDGAVQ